VFVRRGGVVPPLAPLYHGPYKVLQAREKFFTISLGGREDTVSVDRLKPHLGSPVVPAEPPARGRPPRSAVPAASDQPWPLLGGGPCGGHIVILIYSLYICNTPVDVEKILQLCTITV
jgi:hypothetical protein